MKSLILLFVLLLSSCASSSKNSLPDSPDKISPLMVGASVPNAKVWSLSGKELNLTDILTKKKSILIFYRGGWCPYCNRQLQGIRKIEKKLKRLGYQVIGISPDSYKNVQATKTKNKFSYQVYSDSSLNVAKAFGLAFRVDDATNKKYINYGIDLLAASGETHRGLPVPAVYLIDKKGVVKFNYVNPNYKIRLNEKILLTAAREFSK
tara:strand:+ start:31773 stop:32393 length:621 start_codon:yes stop_codon:yes gene_type:complete